MEPRAYKSGATGEPPELPASSAYGYARDASDGLAQTVPGARWFYMIGEEGRNLIIAGNITPSTSDNKQMLRAIRNIRSAVLAQDSDA